MSNKTYKSEFEELRKDKERLDWLESGNAMIWTFEGIKPWQVNKRIELRKQIDAAMQPTNKPSL